MTTFVREDWTLFRSLSTIGQKAGVGLNRLRRLVLKELVDNALDACEQGVTIERKGKAYVVQDLGPGVPGAPEEIANLFSIGRPLSSSKLRVPSRGALGNGLRVVSGAVLASAGSMVVETRGMRLELDLRDDGTTRVKQQEPCARTQGTSVEITLGPGVPEDKGELAWAKMAIAHRGNITYKEGPSCYWYCSDSFYELLLSAGATTPVVEVVKRFAKVSRKILSDLGDLGLCGEVTRELSDSLLGKLRSRIAPVKPTRLVAQELIGNARVFGEFNIVPGRGKYHAELPFSVEVLATKADNDEIYAFVNGTPITEDLRVYRGKPTELMVYGCGLSHSFLGVCKSHVRLFLNIVIPYMPIKSDGKEPDFSRMFVEIQKALQKATRHLKSSIAKTQSPQSEIILDNLSAAIKKVSGEGKHRFSLRQLFYAIRPYVLGKYDELDYNYFSKVITDYEATKGEIAGMYRDPRGVLYHPHTRETIPIGTLAVEEYKRPAWTFRRILYCEKEGLFTVLKDAQWPERNDCALLSSKGFASRAVRDVLDLLGDSEEEIKVFCIHDGDASGTLIYQALQEGTRARPGRRVEVVNLGLEPWEAVRLGLQVESFTTKGTRKLPVARYVKDRDTSRNERWESWLQGKRVELNAMTSPEFLAWLDKKMAPHGNEKIVPPEKIIERRLRETTRAKLRAALEKQILREADLEGRLKEQMGALDFKVDSSLVAQGLQHHPSLLWSEVVDNLADGTIQQSAGAPNEIDQDVLWEEVASLLKENRGFTGRPTEHPAHTAVLVYTATFGLDDFTSRIQANNLVLSTVFSILGTFELKRDEEHSKARVALIQLGLGSSRARVREATLDLAQTWKDFGMIPILQEHKEPDQTLDLYRQAVIGTLETERDYPEDS